MDPDATLEELRELAAQPGAWSDYELLARIRELFESLDDWMSKGGYTPKKWCAEPVQLRPEELGRRW